MKRPRGDAKRGAEILKAMRALSEKEFDAFVMKPWDDPQDELDVWAAEAVEAREARKHAPCEECGELPAACECEPDDD